MTLTFAQAFKKMPVCLIDGFDGLHHKTAADLLHLVETWLDLVDEGEIELNPSDCNRLMRFRLYLRKNSQ